MMREYLFRGKCCGEWIEGSLIHAGSYVCILQDESKVHPMDFPYLDSECGIIDGKAEPVDPETVGQFTGLTDKNGKKIFEGDILKHQINIKTAIVGKIIFVCGAFVFVSSYFKGELISFVDNEIAFPVNCIEVIGNIHDNPELLEGGVEECVKS